MSNDAGRERFKFSWGWSWQENLAENPLYKAFVSRDRKLYYATTVRKVVDKANTLTLTAHSC